MKLGYFPPEAAFLPALAKLWLETGEANEDGLLILPTRRAARALAGAFLAENQGQALLLPRIAALGNLDEAALTLAGALDVPPAIAPMRRQAMLTRLILARDGAGGAPTKLHTAWALAADLASLLDEADYAEINLGQALPGLVAEALASHWQITLDFLKIITEAWPAILAAERKINPAARQVALIEAQRATWEAAAPQHRVWLVTGGGIAAFGRLARCVAGLPRGQVIFHGFDPHLPEAAWEALEESHAQAGIARLLGVMGARREEVLPLSASTPSLRARTLSRALRSRTLSRALLPATALHAWQAPAALELVGLKKLEAPEEAQNALAIAMVLREALETPGRTAALITPDRALAERVASALTRFGVLVDDSAGEALAATPPAVFLRHLARAVAAEFAPLPLLALLKHPLAAGGLPPELFRADARALELAALRGPRPGPGLDGIKFRLAETGTPALRDFLARLEVLLRPAMLTVNVNSAAALRALITAAEHLAATPEAPGAARLWAGEAGIALSEHFLEALEALQDVPDVAAADLPAFLDTLLEGAVLRRPRARDRHPRIAIWGLNEAAMQHVDVAVLGGLVEGVWPALADPGPWASRPMRRAAGLPAPEEAIGQAAHAFFSLGCACGEVVLAAPRRRERAPAVPARWLTRLEAMVSGAGLSLARHPAAAWALALDQPRARLRRPPPMPRPPEAARPKNLSISEFATLLANPYAVYAARILRITPLEPLDAESDASLFGEIVHGGLARFFDIPGAMDLPDAGAQLETALLVEMRARRPRPALAHWWSARLSRIAAWMFEAEAARRENFGPPLALALEAKGELDLNGFILTGRADRIERRENGDIAILDYKTGTVPEPKDVQNGTSPQLPLEAVMARNGAFGEAFAGPVAELGYVKLSGRHAPGEDKPLFAEKPETLQRVIAAAAEALPRLFEYYASPETPYLAQPNPLRPHAHDAYGGVSRIAEWGADGHDGD